MKTQTSQGANQQQDPNSKANVYALPLLNEVNERATFASYAEITISFKGATITDGVRRWLQRSGADRFVEASPNLLTCIMKVGPKTINALESHPSIARISKIRRLSLGRDSDALMLSKPSWLAVT